MKGYRLESQSAILLNNSEILAVCKILLESRSMLQDEMIPILDKLIACCVPEQSKQMVTELLANEKYHYIEPHHGKHILNGLWEIAQAVQNHQLMEIEYERLKEPKQVKRVIKPVGIMFSEYYFILRLFWKTKLILKPLMIYFLQFIVLTVLENLKFLMSTIQYLTKIVSGRRVPKTCSVYVWRQAKEDKVQIYRYFNRICAGQTSHSRNNKKMR